METTKKVKRRPKMRHTVLRNLVAESRAKVITADLELTFLLEMRKKDPNWQPPNGQYEQLVAEFKVAYDYYMERLSFFKKMKAAYEADIDEVAKEVAATTPETVKVKKEK